MYATQAIPPIDAEIAEKGHLWTETLYSAWACTNCGGRSGKGER